MVVIGSCLLYTHGTAEIITIQIENKERISTGSGDSLDHKYLVFCKDETFENTDSLYMLKWSSSDLQNDLKDGQEYQVLVYGWRIPFLSWYRNIVEIQPTT
jgi:hypothetical protein